MLEQTKWFETVSKLINNDVSGFYERYYKSKLVPTGKDIRLNPCPFCGHNDCFTVTPGFSKAHCFSCRAKGFHLSLLYEHHKNNPEILITVGKHYNVAYVEEKTYNSEEEKHIQDIREYAVGHFSSELFTNEKYLKYQVDNRHHSIDALKTFKVGATLGIKQLMTKLLQKGYSQDEVDKAGVWFPEGLFVYPYTDPTSRKILKFNTKNPFQVEYKGSVINGFSTGNKTYMMATPSIFYKEVILVEGENDLITLFEEGARSVIALGGAISKEQLETLKKLLERFQCIYVWTDNDEKGESYVKEIDEALPHKDVRRVVYDKAFKDPDEFYKENNKGTPPPLKELLEKAERLPSTGFKVTHHYNHWVIANRDKKIEFELTTKGKNNSFVGIISYFERGALKDKAYECDLAKFKVKPMNFHLLNEMEAHFNHDIESKNFEDLVSIFPYTRYRDMAVKMLAQIVHDSQDPESVIEYIKIHLDEEAADIVLKEVNDIQNKSIIDYSDIVKIRVSQFFSVKNNDAFFYFTYVKEDGDTIRKLPYFLTNQKTMVRLDLYRRKDPQCVILLKNRYELPFEITEAVGELQENSLTQHWAEKYLEEKIDIAELQIPLLVKRLENFIRKFYYFEDQSVYKILALYSFATYCYELFGEFPYLYLNGPKGAGKSTLGTILYMTCFNSKYAVSTSEAALFRSVAVDGGTFILDEMETLTNRAKSQESSMAPILKGGYTRVGKVRRCNPEKNEQVEGFEVFGPKIILNIYGLEDVISDRCITINVHEASSEQRKTLERVQNYMQENLSLVKELTSKCCLSVIEHFQQIFNVFRQEEFYTGNARLSQILTPIMVIAKMAGAEYQTALTDFYNNHISLSKEEVESSTPEGALRDILLHIALEVSGAEPPYFLQTAEHKYREPIAISEDKTTFTVNSMHLKSFLEEELGTTTKINLSDITAWSKRVPIFIDLRDNRKRTTATLEDQTLIDEFMGNIRVKVYTYTYHVDNVLKKGKVISKEKKKETIEIKAQPLTSKMSSWKEF